MYLGFKMFIIVLYKDSPELSTVRRNSSEMDLSVEKALLVNPNCPVRIMLEYIRKRCKLGTFTQFDLCDESGGLMGLFNLPTYAYATENFIHKRTYYLIVLKYESDKSTSVLPQLNRENVIYSDLKLRVTNYLLTGEVSASKTSMGKTASPGKATPVQGKRKSKSTN